MTDFEKGYAEISRNLHERGITKEHYHEFLKNTYPKLGKATIERTVDLLYPSICSSSISSGCSSGIS